MNPEIQARVWLSEADNLCWFADDLARKNPVFHHREIVELREKAQQLRASVRLLEKTPA